MSGTIIPALLAAGGGSAMLGGIWAYERSRDEAMRRSRQRLSLRFPIGLEPLRSYAALDAFSGVPLHNEIVLETVADETGVSHGLWVPAAVRRSVEGSLRGLIPSIRVSEAPALAPLPATLVLRLFVATPVLLAGDQAEATSLALLAGLTALHSGEQLILRWALRSGGPRRLPAREPQTQAQREIQRAWRHKTALPGMRVSGLISVRAASATRARSLAGHVENTIRSRRGLCGEIRITRESRGHRSMAYLPRTSQASGWLTSAESLALIAWPLGSDVPAGVHVGAARELLVPRYVPAEGRVLFTGRDTDGPRAVALSPEAQRHHLAIVGPTGVGKSALIANCVLSDIAAGGAGVVIDPKGPDLVNSILERVPAEDAGRLVVLDPADPRPTPGVALLSGGDPDLRAEVLTGALRSIFADVWSIRTDYYLRLALRSLGEVPGATLADLGRLFFEERFRRAVVARLSDPFLVAAWRHFEGQLTSGDRAAHVQAPMARVMALLNMPRVRAVLASRDPKVDVAQLTREGKWLLVSLSPGQLGEGPANFVGAALMYVVWSAIEARAAVAPDQRPPVSLYVDELATLAGVPFSFELLAERARGLGAAITVAVQTLGRVPEPTRSSLLGNVATLLTFRAAHDDAARISRELPGLSVADIMALGQFEVAARIGTGGGSAVTVVTGRTHPLPATTGLAEAIRDRSADQYGSRTTAAVSGPGQVPDEAADEPVGRKRRKA